MNTLESKKPVKGSSFSLRTILITAMMGIIVPTLTCVSSRVSDYGKKVSMAIFEVEQLKNNRDKDSELIRKLFESNKNLNERVIKLEVSVGYLEKMEKPR